jgi:hypothetical protein
MDSQTNKNISYTFQILIDIIELFDHLGNVRATFGEDASGDLQTYTYSDYFPFGMKIPGRLKTAGEYRFGYQGQFAEEDEETGYNAFETRLWHGGSLSIVPALGGSGYIGHTNTIRRLW